MIHRLPPTITRIRKPAKNSAMRFSRGVRLKSMWRK
jgi:hypothetical protein